MASFLYSTGKNSIANAGVNWGSDTISAALVSNSYTPNSSTDQYFSTVSSAQISTSVNLSSKTSSAGACSCANATFSAVASGSTIYYVVLYKNTGTNSTSQLICLYDFSSSTVATNGGDITLSFSGAAFTV